MPTALDRLREVARPKGLTKGDIRRLCEENLGTAKWSELTDTQRWGLVFLVEPTAHGPFGHSMEAF